ncbi:MAG: SDR family oxidoreductase [Alphaproteobacteria bacterium]|nr:SDR family oxidoreductase [Alphaproteobacteria bacterium]
MQDKICLITGANTGIGKATAIALAKMGANVTIVCRTDTSGETAASEISAASGNDNVQHLTADLGSLAAIRQVAKDFLATHDRLDVLINNAGLLMPKRELTVDGFETHFAVNHLAYFLLTSLLLDALKAAPAGRIVSVSSMAHTKGIIDFDDLQAEKKYGALQVYSNSKLANILFTYELARRLSDTNVTANCLHPGVIASSFFRRLPAPLRSGAGLVLTGVEKGAATSIYLASSPDVEGVTGKYFANSAPKSSSKASYDVEAAKRLWQISEQMTGLAG